MKSRPPGRPLIGAKKRIKATFTLSQESVMLLNALSKSHAQSKSALLEFAIDKLTLQTDSHQKPQIEPRIPIPADQINALCRTHRICQMYLYGSVLGDDFGPNSDIDVLVEFESGASPGLFEMYEIQSKLSQVFGNRLVDLKTPSELSRYFRDEVKAAAHPIFGANSK